MAPGRWIHPPGVYPPGGICPVAQRSWPSGGLCPPVSHSFLSLLSKDVPTRGDATQPGTGQPGSRSSGLCQHWLIWGAPPASHRLPFPCMAWCLPGHLGTVASTMGPALQQLLPRLALPLAGHRLHSGLSGPLPSVSLPVPSSAPGSAVLWWRFLSRRPCSPAVSISLLSARPPQLGAPSMCGKAGPRGGRRRP